MLQLSAASSSVLRHCYYDLPHVAVRRKALGGICDICGGDAVHFTWDGELALSQWRPPLVRTHTHPYESNY
jgi:hypothetical protein